MNDNISRKAKKIAMSNDQLFHFSSILYRGKHIVRIGTNSDKTHPRFARKHRNGEHSYHLHAEMDVIRFAKPGDTLKVFRWSAKGEPTMAKPCAHCEKFIREAGISKVEYTDWDGEIQELKI